MIGALDDDIRHLTENHSVALPPLLKSSTTDSLRIKIIMCFVNC